MALADYSIPAYHAAINSIIRIHNKTVLTSIKLTWLSPFAFSL